MDDLKTIAEEDTEEMKNEAYIKAARLKIGEGIKGSASWFFFIVGLSLVNSLIILFTQWNRNFVIGLGITRIIDEVSKGKGSIGIIIALVLDLVISGLFVLFGIFGRKKHLWAFIAGMILYTLDGILLLFFKEFFGVLFHGIVLFYLFKGLKILIAFEKMNTQAPPS
jgi:hypothetical protein